MLSAQTDHYVARDIERARSHLREHGTYVTVPQIDPRGRSTGKSVGTLWVFFDSRYYEKSENQLTLIDNFLRLGRPHNFTDRDPRIPSQETARVNELALRNKLRSFRAESPHLCSLEDEHVVSSPEFWQINPPKLIDFPISYATDLFEQACLNDVGTVVRPSLQQVRRYRSELVDVHHEIMEWTSGKSVIPEAPFDLNQAFRKSRKASLLQQFFRFGHFMDKTGRLVELDSQQLGLDHMCSMYRPAVVVAKPHQVANDLGRSDQMREVVGYTRIGLGRGYAVEFR